MDKSAIEKFSINARIKLRNSVDSSMAKLGFGPGRDVESIQSIGNITVITLPGGIQTRITNDEAKYRERLAEVISKDGYDNVVEQIAYTWFNRLIAIRYMEVNDFLPTHVRVLSSNNPDKTEPDLVSQCLTVNLGLSDPERETITELRDTDRLDELFSKMFIFECRSLNRILPELFALTKPYENMLLNLSYTSPDSVVRSLVDDIPEDDFRDAVQIIGWMYQYYNTEQNELVYDGSLSRSKLSKELVPAATTIYTPDWIVKYMVDNSLGRLWMERGLTSIDKPVYLKSYVCNDEKCLEPTDIRLIDPCMGSGHILVYAFDLLMTIYRSYGYSDSDSVELVLTHNLYGLDISERAYQLSYFAIMMKARQYSSSFFDKKIEPNLSLVIESEDVHYKVWFDLNDNLHDFNIEAVQNKLHNAREYGSLLSPINEYLALEKAIQFLKNHITLDYNVKDESTVIKKMIKFCSILSNRYDIVVTNPPYLRSSRFNERLSDFSKRNYPLSKGDLSIMMYEAMLKNMAKDNGYLAFITTNSWMFIDSFTKFRENLLKTYDLIDLVDLGSELFDGKVGHNLIVSWITKRSCSSGILKATKLDKFCYSLKDLKEKEYFNPQNEYSIPISSLIKIPGMPIAYWISEKFIDNFAKGIHISSISEYTGSQNKTANNDKYLRFWWEVDKSNIGPNKKWVQYAKGGDFRKYYGNLLHIIDWSDEARLFYDSNKTSNLLKSQYWYKEGITYTEVSSKGPCFRYLPPGCVFDMSGPSILSLGSNLYYCLGFLNSDVSYSYLKILNPTIHTQLKDVNNLPLILDERIHDRVSQLVRDNVNFMKNDWDENEFSIDYTLPLKKSNSGLIADSVREHLNLVLDREAKLKSNEKELNSIFNELYNFEGTTQIQTYSAGSSEEKDIKKLISFAVGCMIGRYSPDNLGIKQYRTDSDNIIPINDNEYFGDDIVSNFIEFVKLTYGKETLEENLRYIASYLKGKGTAREKIRLYFLNEFYEGHLKLYNNMPIYWLFDSGKANGFKALIYMHRYTPDLIGKMRQDYLLPMQRRYSEQLKTESDSIVRSKLEKKLEEISTYDLAMELYSSNKVSIDLNDGIKVNYAKFQNIDNPGGKGKINLLYKIK